ncbi:MAG: hypothetical protein AABN33_27155 [Acidobacteriota bacterium]
MLLILARDDITSVSVAAEAPHSTGKDEAGYPGEDRVVEGKDLE